MESSADHGSRLRKMLGAWETITTQTDELEKAGMLTPDQAHRYRLVVQQYQADLNYCVTNTLTTLETEEAGQFEKLRLAFEARLKVVPKITVQTLEQEEAETQSEPGKSE